MVTEVDPPQMDSNEDDEDDQEEESYQEPKRHLGFQVPSHIANGSNVSKTYFIFLYDFVVPALFISMSNGKQQYKI